MPSASGCGSSGLIVSVRIVSVHALLEPSSPKARSRTTKDEAASSLVTAAVRVSDVNARGLRKESSDAT